MGGYNYKQRRDDKSQISYARTPYNFIPFPDKFASKYVSFDDLPSHEHLDINKKTGYISYTITAETPIYVGGENGEFYSIGDSYAIPGSTIKGKLRSNCEILSNSYPEFIHKAKYSFRDVAGVKSSIKNEYQKFIKTTEDKRINSIVRAGLLENVNGNYKIHQLEGFNDINGNKLNFLFVKGEMLEKTKNSTISSKKLNSKYYKPYFLVCESNEYDGKWKPSTSILDKCKLVEKSRLEFKYAKRDWIRDGRFILMNSGKIGNKKNHYLLKGKVGKTITVSEKAIYDAQIRLNRSKGKDEEGNNHSSSYYELPTSGFTKPCFYLMDENNRGEVLAIGFTPYMRLPYKYSTTDGIKGEIEPGISYADGIFGFTDYTEGDDNKSYKSRVTCTHAISDSSVSDTKIIPIRYMLQKPKPTSFQMYLKQDSKWEANKYKSINDMAHYSSEAGEADFELRGRKFYWMKTYIDNKTSDHPTASTTIKPLEKGTVFKGKINFKNLDDAELGLLLFSLKFDDNYDCKDGDYITYESFGQGKPYGFGRTKISINEIRIEDITYRYSDSGRVNISSVKETADIYKSMFIDEYKSKINNKAFYNVDNNIIRAYRVSKTIGKTLDNNDKFEYMDIKEFKYRPVLRNVEEYAEFTELKPENDVDNTSNNEVDLSILLTKYNRGM